jgi:hypothetical protein
MIQLVIEPAAARYIFVINGPLRPVLHCAFVWDLFLAVSKHTGWRVRHSGHITELSCD